MPHRFATALSFLTIFRLPFSSTRPFSPEDLARSFATFPLVGLLLGACALLFAFALGPFTPPLLLAGVLAATLALLTRGLHLDGLADLADGFWGGYTPERRLDIMRDSRIGSFGVLALLFATLLKTASLHALITAGSFAPLLIVPALSRWGMVLAAYGSRYARNTGGMAKPFLEHMTRSDLFQASALAFLIALLINPRHCLLYIPATAVLSALLRTLSQKRIGGVTGDVLGAVNEIGEVALFALAACLATP